MLGKCLLLNMGGGFRTLGLAFQGGAQWFSRWVLNPGFHCQVLASVLLWSRWLVYFTLPAELQALRAAGHCQVLGFVPLWSKWLAYFIVWSTLPTKPQVLRAAGLSPMSGWTSGSHRLGLRCIQCGGLGLWGGAWMYISMSLLLRCVWGGHLLKLLSMESSRLGGMLVWWHAGRQHSHWTGYFDLFPVMRLASRRQPQDGQPAWPG